MNGHRTPFLAFYLTLKSNKVQSFIQTITSSFKQKVNYHLHLTKSLFNYKICPIMNLSIAIVFALIILAVALFTTEIISFDLTALIIAGSLMATGILTVKEGLSGFSNQATITIGAMFILSEGLRQTGVLRAVGSVLTFLGKQSFWIAAIAIMVITAGVSAFINNTAAVAIFIPVIIGVAKNLGTSPSKLLIPLSFASISGGVCTLIGTSTNILVNSIAADRGVETFSMFDFFPLGIILLVTVLLYLIV